MAISLKVLAPNKNVYQGEAEEVILPSTTGQLVYYLDISL